MLNSFTCSSTHVADSSVKKTDSNGRSKGGGVGEGCVGGVREAEPIPNVFFYHLTKALVFKFSLAIFLKKGNKDVLS